LINIFKFLLLAMATMTTTHLCADVSVQFTSLLQRHALASGVDITQLGDLNVADVTQSGQGHYALTLQQGVLNHILLQQSGFGNQAQISQFGSHNTAQISQLGDNNLIQIEQWGNRHFSIEQSGVGAEISIIQY
jgi:minor curlin subunit